MAVHHRIDVGAFFEDGAVNEALKVRLAALRVMHIAIQITLHNVSGRDRRGRHAARNEESFWVVRMPHADVAEAIKHAFVGQDLIGGGQVL